MDYSAVDVSWWKELEAIAKKNMDTHWIPNHWRSFRNMYRNIKKYENHFWEYGKKIITFEQFSRMLSKKAGIQPKEAKDYVAANLQNLEHKEILEALLFSLQLIKSEKGLEERSGQNRRAILLRKNLRR